VRKRAVYAKLCVLLVYPYTCCIRVIAKFVEASHSRTVVHLQSTKCSKYWNYIGMTFKQVKESYSTRNTCVDHCMQSWIYVDIPFDCRDRLPDSQVTFHYALAHNVCIMFGLNKQCEEAKGNHRHAAQSVNAQNMYIDFCMHIYVDHTSDQWELHSIIHMYSTLLKFCAC